jgi:hypothetical protein
VLRTIVQLNPFSRRATTITNPHRGTTPISGMGFGAWIWADRRWMTASLEMTPKESAKVVLISA